MREDREESDEDIPLPEVFQSLIDDVDLEDFDLNFIINHSHKSGFLILLCELKSGEIVPVPFDKLHYDYPHETKKYIKEKVVGKFRRDFYQ